MRMHYNVLLVPCRTPNTVDATDLGNVNDNALVNAQDGYPLLPFYVIGNEAGWFPQIQVSNIRLV